MGAAVMSCPATVTPALPEVETIPWPIACWAWHYGAMQSWGIFRSLCKPDQNH